MTTLITAAKETKSWLASWLGIQASSVPIRNVYKNVRIVIFGAAGSATNVLRAPGSAAKEY